MNFNEFYEGKEFEAYKYLGAHITEAGVVFRTFAPNAAKVSVIGEFNNFQETEMTPVYDGNFYECTIPKAQEGMKYQYRIYKNETEYCDHCDPYGFGMELRPEFSSIIRNLEDYQFQDSQWINHRGKSENKPVNIYEVHLGSFQKAEDGKWLTYEELAEKLVCHVKKMGYNYIEFMPLSEHPSDKSWGYQNTGFFSPTSRYGDAKGLMKLVDICHQNHIGVIMDCMVASFAIDSYGLADYDGQPLYEYPHKDVAINEWGSCNFIHSRGEVRSFLQSVANYWLSEYHFDGLRIGSINRIVYWQGEKYRGENGIAIDFLKRMNKGLKERFPHCILMAENSSSFSGVTKKVEDSGLGFDYQWDFNWIEDTLKYMSYSPEKRRQQYYILPYSMVYFQDEKYMLALSHDEAAHREKSIFKGIHGKLQEKFPQARTLYMYMYAHPGKILNFMGNESAQINRWNGQDALDWKLSQAEENRKFMYFISELNKVYGKETSLFEKDYAEDGFGWTDCVKDGTCTYTMKRSGKKESIYGVFNFDSQPCKNYTLNVGETERVAVIFNSDWECFGGSSKREEIQIETERIAGGNRLVIDVPAFTGVYLKEV